MAVKKRSTTSATKAAVRKTAPKTTTEASTATKTKAAPKAADAKKPAAAKKAAIRLTDKQLELLRKVQATGETGYMGGSSGEIRSLEALQGKKVLKKLAKDKASGKTPFAITKVGEKHLATSA